MGINIREMSPTDLARLDMLIDVAFQQGWLHFDKRMTPHGLNTKLKANWNGLVFTVAEMLEPEHDYHPREVPPPTKPKRTLRSILLGSKDSS